MHAFEKCNHSARVCFNIAGDDARTEYHEKRVREAVAGILQPTKAAKSYGYREVASDLHLLFDMVPSPNRCPLATISRHGSRIFIETGPSVEEIRQLYKLLIASVATSQGAEHIYESYTLQKLIAEGVGLSFRSLDNLFQIAPWSTGPALVQYFSLKTPQKFASGIVYVPESRKIPTYDAASAPIVNGTNVVYLWKFTLSAQNRIRVADLDELADKLPQTSGFTMPSQRWQLVYVIPTSLNAQFTAQGFEGVDSKRQWRERSLIAQQVVMWDI